MIGYPKSTGNMCGKKLRCQHSNKPVSQYTVCGKLVNSFKSLTEASQSNEKFTIKGISMCVTGNHKTHGGYIWKYTE